MLDLVVDADRQLRAQALDGLEHAGQHVFLRAFEIELDEVDAIEAVVADELVDGQAGEIAQGEVLDLLIAPLADGLRAVFVLGHRERQNAPAIPKMPGDARTRWARNARSRPARNR